MFRPHTWAEYSPRLCPATKLGFGIRLSQHPQSRNRSGKNRRLGNLGQPKLVFRAFEAELRKLVAERVVGFFESLAGHGIFLGQFFAHADSLRALAGKMKCDLLLIRVIRRRSARSNVQCRSTRTRLLHGRAARPSRARSPR